MARAHEIVDLTEDHETPAKRARCATATVHRTDGRNQTMLRREASRSRDPDVMLPCGTRVAQGERVTVVWSVGDGCFTRVRTSAGVTGLIQTEYLQMERTNVARAPPRVHSRVHAPTRARV